MSDKIVSFIMPAYNAADTIVRCLDSIYALSLKPDKFEVIVIDDASTDDTVRVIENYRDRLAVGDRALAILRQPENHRQGAARNRGVKIAKGEYICFVDADDAVTEGAVKAIRSATENKTDMTAYHYAFVNEQGVTTKEADRLYFEEGQLFSGIEMQNLYPYWCSAPWGYIFRRSFIEQVNYPFVEGVLFEDSDFVAVHLYHAKRMTYTSELGYKAYEREGSTTRHTSYKNVADYLLLGVRMMRFYDRIKNEGLKESMNERDKFAEGILEGACWNVQKSCNRMIKLGNVDAVRSYYERIKEHVDLNYIYSDIRYRKYYWNEWTSLCIGHERLATLMLAVLTPMYKIVKKCKA